MSAKLSDNPSKADEVKFLSDFAANLPESSYLKSLISPALIAWFQSSVRDDLSCDVMGCLKQVSHEKLMADMAAAKDLTAMQVQLKQAKDDLKSECERHEEDNRQGFETVKSLSDANDHYNAEIIKLNNRVIQLLNEQDVFEKKAAQTETQLKNAIADLYLQLKTKGA